MSKNIKILLITLAVLAIIGYLLQTFFPEKEALLPPTTTPEIEVSIDEEASSSAKEIGDQGRLDMEFNEKVAKHIENYPWYQDFPIVAPEYTIVYDYDLESFRIRLQISKSSPLEIKIVAQEKALKTLKEKLSNPNEWEYHFLYSED